MIKKVLLGLLGLVILLSLGGFAYVESTYLRDFSKVPLPDIKASTDPLVIAQGEYVANALVHCPICHGAFGSKTDPKFRDRGDLRGGMAIEAGPFGTFYMANITPDPETGIGKYSDGQLARVIRSGVHPDGRLSAMMALAVGRLADEDLVAVVSYLRSLKPVKNVVPRSEWGFVAKALAGKIGPSTLPIPKYVAATATASVERGEYIAKGPGFCIGCHTPFDMMEFKPGGAPFSGESMAEPDPSDDKFEIAVPNLTPHPKTGHITAWTEDAFVARFKSGRIYKGSKMPWESFSQMTEADLRSVYRFLRTVPPVDHAIGPSRREAGWKP
ncbi:MAG: hypothetical protein HYV07_25460 [Deltaproteobacteria bacterium]|nr:hypothetical protein [Deltaproteobacteria bacterium]